MVPVDPVRRHIAAAGPRGARVLALCDWMHADLSWALLAFPPDVACERAERVLARRLMDVCGIDDAMVLADKRACP